MYAFKDETAAGKFLANFQGDAAGTCLQKSLEKSPVGKRAGGSPTSSPVTDLQGVGDGSVGHELTVDLPVQGQLTPAYIDFIAVGVGRAWAKPKRRRNAALARLDRRWEAGEPAYVHGMDADGVVLVYVVVGHTGDELLEHDSRL